MPISQEEALKIAVRRFREKTGSDHRPCEENLSAQLVRYGGKRLWAIFWRADPAAGGSGKMMVDADTGEITFIDVPGGQQ